jgi:hypothetical protein
MGACYEENDVIAKNEKELLLEYKALIKQALHDHGHSGYTGTIAESPDLKIVKDAEMNLEEASDYIEEHARKWESTLAIKIKDSNKWLLGGVYSS